MILKHLVCHEGAEIGVAYHWDKEKVKVGGKTRYFDLAQGVITDYFKIKNCPWRYTTPNKNKFVFESKLKLELYQEGIRKLKEDGIEVVNINKITGVFS